MECHDSRNQEALALYTKMQQEGIMVADKVTFVCLLKACARVEALQQGIQLHAQIVERGLEADMVVGSCLVDMYAKCGRLREARKVFDGLPTKDVVTWTAMIAGYAEHGLGLEALELRARMEQEGLILAHVFTFARLLKACASVGAIDQAKQLHSQIMDRGLRGDIVVGNALVDMYAKCGSLEDAVKVFESLPNGDVITWTALINGYGQSNAGQKAIQCFQDMLQEGVRPNETTFTCPLVACAHEGLVNESRHFFNTMVNDHGIVPTTKHYNCMGDLLGRSGRLAEAEEMLLSMPSGGNDVGFTSVLNACKCHGDVDMGMRCFQRLTKLDPTPESAYVLMANIYADAGRWADVERIQSCQESCRRGKETGAHIVCGRRKG